MRRLVGLIALTFLASLGTPGTGLCANPVQAATPQPKAAGSLPSPTPCPACGKTPVSKLPEQASAHPASASPIPVATNPPAPVRVQPFKSRVVAVTKHARTFRMGKKIVHVVHVTEATKLLHGNGTPASFEELGSGVEIRGSYRKRPDGELDAVTLKIGPKSPSPATNAIDEDTL